MFTEPEIVSTENLRIRGYVKVYIDGERHRFYNGKMLGITCNPNHAKTVRERNKALSTLAYNLRKKLEDGWKPEAIHERNTASVANVPLAGECFQNALSSLDKEDLSDLYKRDISSVGTAFTEHLENKNLLVTPINQINEEIIEDFLKQYNTSATHYMNKRRILSAIFSRWVRKEIQVNPVKETKRIKEKATLHKAYTKEQLRQVLNILEQSHKNLYVCSLLVYGCFLRPHQEVRQLFRRDLNEHCTSISLSGDDNKSGRVRTVFVPPYAQDAIRKYNLHLLDRNANLFTGCCDVFNESYFNTAWSRLKEDMMKENIIDSDHTLYSFRHTAAVNLYMKTKDLYKIQQAMGHSSMNVTLTYMRSLGLVNNISADDVPEL